MACHEPRRKAARRCRRDRGIFKRGNRYWLKWYLPEIGIQRAPLIPAGRKTATDVLDVARIIASEYRRSGLPARELIARRRRGASVRPVASKPADRKLTAWLEPLVGPFRRFNRRKAAGSHVDRNVSRIRMFLASERIAAVEQISPAVIDEYLGRLEEAELSPSTVAGYRSALSVFCRFLIVRGLVSSNAARDAMGPQVNLPAPTYLDQVEYDKTLALAESHRILPEVGTGLWTGMRRGELARLEWPDVAWDNRTIVLLVTKTRTPRNIPMPDRLAEVLAAHALATRGDRRPRSGAVFVHPLDAPPRWAGRPRGRSWWRGALDPIKREIPKFDEIEGTGRTWHILRHTFCSRLVQRGISLRKIADWAGHTSMATTLRYAHLQPGYDRDVEAVV